MLDQAFESLKTYDWGVDPSVLNPIEEAIVASQTDADVRRSLEEQLTAVLNTDVTYDAKDYVCRKLMQIGSAACVPTLSGMLSDEKMSHMARYALERIPDAAAGDALREAMGEVDADQKVGILSSLGARQEAASVAAIAPLLQDTDVRVANSAAHALGAIRSKEASDALRDGAKREEVKMAATDASLACAEALLADGNKLGALAIYKRCAAGSQPKHVKLAATRGMLACAAK